MSGKYSRILRDHADKNKAVLVARLMQLSKKHALFGDLTLVDIIVQYSDSFFPRFAKFPERLLRLSVDEMRHMLEKDS